MVGLCFCLSSLAKESDQAAQKKCLDSLSKTKQVYPIMIAIGDIHGSIAALKKLMRAIKAKYDLKKVRLVFLGDYVDRGEDNKATLEYLIQLKKKYPHFVFLMGNHDYMIVKGKPWGLDDGTAAQFDYRGQRILKAHMKFLEELEPYFEGRNFDFLHVAPDFPGKGVSELPLKKYDTHRYPIFGYAPDDEYRGTKRVIYGHDPEYSVRYWGKTICIDTSCVFGGDLTALVVNDKTGKIKEEISVQNPR